METIATMPTIIWNMFMKICNSQVAKGAGRYVPTPPFSAYVYDK